MKKKQILQNPKEYSFDAKGEVLGRLASKIAFILTGKNHPNFYPYLDNKNIIKVKNINAVKISGKKLEQKLYQRHSGYPGGLKTKTLKELMDKNPEEVLKKAVWRMLPKNRLRAKKIKRLIFIKEKHN